MYVFMYVCLCTCIYAHVSSIFHCRVDSRRPKTTTLNIYCLSVRDHHCILIQSGSSIFHIFKPYSPTRLDFFSPVHSQQTPNQHFCQNTTIMLRRQPTKITLVHDDVADYDGRKLQKDQDKSKQQRGIGNSLFDPSAAPRNDTRTKEQRLGISRN
jgi:hypothetical protein